MGKRNGKGRQQGHVVTWAQAWRDVMQSAMARGLLIPITISIVLMIAAWRMPGEDVSSVAFSIIGGLKDHSLVGWALCVLLAVAWNWHARVMRRCFSAEAQRIGNEKTKYQQKQTARELGSSDK
ncbi:MAG: hypothetical protein ACTID4_12670 [Hafnia alvei]|uniref:hypothetical protein n=1 Tax=Hafnia alvei TaxID=569 RepID=UPI003F919B5F